MAEYCSHLACARFQPCPIHPPTTQKMSALNAQFLLGGAKKLRHVLPSEKKEVAPFSEEDTSVELVPGLFLGSLKSASNASQITELEITHVLTVCSQTPAKFDGIIYEAVVFEDKDHVDLTEILKKCFPFIRGAIEDKGKCLVHCHHGISRSASVCMAYIMTFVQPNSTFAEVWRFTKQKRPVVHPNDGFKAQLTALEKQKEAKGRPEYPVDNDDPSIFVTVREDQINNNNLQGKAGYPYTFIDVQTGQEFSRPTAEENKEIPFCSLCFRKFATFTEQEVHKAKPCYQDVANSHMTRQPIKIIFQEDHLTYIGDAIKAMNMQLSHEELSSSIKLVSVTVDVSDLEITLRRFYFAQISKYNLEQWYPGLVAHHPSSTAPTIILPLSDDELQLLSRLAAVELAHKMGLPSRETNAELEGRAKLEDRILRSMLNDSEAQEEPNDDGQQPVRTKQAYFCKFSTRSPKDAKATSANAQDGSLESRLAAKLEALKVRNGLEVVELLTHSQRIFSDISLYFQYRVPQSSSAELCLILRRWVDMPQDHEFRCFVSNGQLTAISQYHCYYVFEALQNKAHVEKIRDAIMRCFEAIKTSFTLQSYVLDVAVFPDDCSCSVIELNPFGSHMSSGAALFNWETDGMILFGPCEGPPVIRILKHLIDKGK